MLVFLVLPIPKKGVAQKEIPSCVDNKSGE